ncbi:hypothetical protein C8R43DRAFT_622149 [Mycena crocata]|nr:hypothetical protein C8R43DRAFT_622149 [Mycena crocata]
MAKSRWHGLKPYINRLRQSPLSIPFPQILHAICNILTTHIVMSNSAVQSRPDSPALASSFSHPAFTPAELALLDAVPGLQLVVDITAKHEVIRDAKWKALDEKMTRIISAACSSSPGRALPLPRDVCIDIRADLREILNCHFDLNEELLALRVDGEVSHLAIDQSRQLVASTVHRTIVMMEQVGAWTTPPLRLGDDE